MYLNIIFQRYYFLLFTKKNIKCTYIHILKNNSNNTKITHVKHRKEYQKSVGYHGKNVSARREIERHGVILRFYETIVWFVANDGVQQLRTMLSSKTP